MPATSAALDSTLVRQTKAKVRNTVSTFQTQRLTISACRLCRRVLGFHGPREAKEGEKKKAKGRKVKEKTQGRVKQTSLHGRPHASAAFSRRPPFFSVDFPAISRDFIGGAAGVATDSRKARIPRFEPTKGDGEPWPAKKFRGNAIKTRPRDLVAMMDGSIDLDEIKALISRC